MEAVPRMPMIWLDLKEAGDFQLSPSVKQFILKNYGENPDNYNEQLKKLESLRQSAVNVTRDFEGCSTLRKYFGQLHYLQSRVPMGPGQEASVPISWTEIFSGKSVTHEDISYEQACILYNLGALHSMLGAMDNRVSEEGMKVSCTHFQCSAGAFSYLRDHFSNNYSVDMSHQILNLNINLMLGQAQECLLEKSMLDNRKSFLVARISAQVVDYYKEACRALENSETASMLGKIQKDWKKLVQMKIYYFASIAHLHMGKQAEEQQKFGERLAYLQSSLDKLNEAIKLAKGQPDSVQEALRFTMDIIGGKYNSAKKDNDFIYHEAVPALETLASVKGAPLVKALPVNPTDPSVTGPDLFSKLVPMAAHEASSLYSEEKAKLLRDVMAKVDSKNETLEQFMDSLGLEPDSVDNLDMYSHIPPVLMEKCAALSVRPDTVKSLVQSMQVLSGVFTDVESSLKEIRDVLEADEADEAGERSLLETVGAGVASDLHPPAQAQALADVRRDLEKYMEAHEKASFTNTELHRAMNLHINNLRLLGGPLEALRDALPSPQLSEEEVGGLQTMKRILGKVQEMRDQRSSFEKQLRDMIQQDDITSTLVTTERADIKRVFEEQLKKYEQLKVYIDQNLSAQENILKALTEANVQYASVRKGLGQVEAQWTATVQGLVGSYEAYEDLMKKSQEGKDFYDDLETKASRLLEKAKLLCQSRADERRPLLYRDVKKPPARPTAAKPSLPPKATDSDSACSSLEDAELAQLSAAILALEGDLPEELRSLPPNMATPPGVPRLPSGPGMSMPWSGAPPAAMPRFPPNLPPPEVLARLAQFTPQGVLRPGPQMAPHMHPQVPQQMPRQMPRQMPQQMPQQMPLEMPRQMPQQMPRQMPQQMPQHMAQHLPQPQIPPAQIPGLQMPPSQMQIPAQHIPTSQMPHTHIPTSQMQMANPHIPPAQMPQTHQPNAQMHPQAAGPRYPGPPSVPVRPSTTTVNTIHAPIPSYAPPHRPPAPAVPPPVPSGYTLPPHMYPHYVPPPGAQPHAQPQPQKPQQFPQPQTYPAQPTHSYPYISPQPRLPPHYQQTFTRQQNGYAAPQAYAPMPPQAPVPQVAPATSQHYMHQSHPQIQGVPPAGQVMPQNYMPALRPQLAAIPRGPPPPSHQDPPGGAVGYPGPQPPILPQPTLAPQPATSQPPSALPLGLPPAQVVFPQAPGSGAVSAVLLPPHVLAVQPANPPSVSPAPPPTLTPQQMPPTTPANPALPSPALPSPSTVHPATSLFQRQNSSTDDLLSCSPESQHGAKPTVNVLQPTKADPQDGERRRRSSQGVLVVQGDPYQAPERVTRLHQELERFRNHVESLELPLDAEGGSSLLDAQWKDLQEQQEKDARLLSIAIARCYTMKNRHQDVMPYDMNRVLLHSGKDDYINASFVDQLSSYCPRLIATQAPLSGTAADFWLMVYEQKVSLIVMLVSEQELDKGRVLRYFPTDRGQQMSQGPITLTLSSQKNSPTHTERMVSLQYREQSLKRTVVHLQFTSWPELGLPESKSHLLRFIQDVHGHYLHQRPLHNPVVVHCSSGVGRTGVFCLLYAAVQELEAGNGLPDLLQLVKKMRQQRKNMLQEKLHLKFCYEAVLKHAEQVLQRHGITTATCSKTTSTAAAKVYSRQESQQDIVLGGDLPISSIQATIAKLSVRPPSVASDPDPDPDPEELQPVSPSPPPALTPPLCMSPPKAPSTPPPNGTDNGLESPSDSAPTAAPSSLELLASLAPEAFSMEGGGTGKQRVTKQSFLHPAEGQGLHGSRPREEGDPLSSLDPLWTLSKT